jgi:hypothetical protein
VQAIIWAQEGGTWRPLPVVLGITDNRETEVLAGLAADQDVAVGIQGPTAMFNFKDAITQVSPANRSL